MKQLLYILATDFTDYTDVQHRQNRSEVPMEDVRETAQNQEQEPALLYVDILTATR